MFGFSAVLVLLYLFLSLTQTKALDWKLEREESEKQNKKSNYQITLVLSSIVLLVASFVILSYFWV